MEAVFGFFSHPIFAGTVAILAILGGLVMIGWRVRDVMARKKEAMAAVERDRHREQLLLERDDNIQGAIADLAKNIDKMADGLSVALSQVAESVNHVGEALLEGQSQIHRERMAMIEEGKGQEK